MKMTMLEKLRQQSRQVNRASNQENANAALLVINDPKLSFSEKVAQVEALDAAAAADEKELFAEIYSSLHNLAKTQTDIELMEGL